MLELNRFIQKNLKFAEYFVHEILLDKIKHRFTKIGFSPISNSSKSALNLLRLYTYVMLQCENEALFVKIGC